ncbi:MAG: glycosyltransferase [Chloroflexi bacterium]|nr:glycosyltransferase [Chloroflexota bacterium]
MRGVAWAVAADFQLVVVHGRRIDSPSVSASDFPPATRFIEWQVQREISVREDARALQALRRIITHFRPALVHAHSSKAGALSRIARLGTHASILYSPHGYAFQRRDVAPWVRRGYWGIEWLMGRLPHVTVTCGPSEFEQGQRLASHVLEIPNAIDLETIDGLLERLPRKPGRPRIVSAGRITPQKDFATFSVLSRDPRLNAADFAWLGGPPGEHEPGHVSITGWLTRSELYRRLAEASVFVLPSLWEGLPLVVLEAMAVGLPVIARPIPGVTDVVRDGVSGYLRETPDELAAAIEQLINDPPLARRMGDAGRQLVEERHDARRLAPEWRSIYRSLAEIHPDEVAHQS